MTYKNLSHWYAELRESRPHIPCILLANKIDGKVICLFYIYYNKPTLTVDTNVTGKNFNFAKKHKLPLYFVSASDGTNVVKVICLLSVLVRAEMVVVAMI